MQAQCGSNRLGSGRNDLNQFSVLWVRKSNKVIPASSKSVSARNGLRFERNCLKALARGDFTQSLGYLFSDSERNATVAFQDSTLSKTKLNFQLFHNPCFEYKLQNETTKFCFPDIVLEINFDPPANLNAAKLPFPTNQSPAKNNFPANQFAANSNQIPAKSIPANFIILIEVKLTWVPIAWEKLNNLYIPLAAKLYNLPILPLVIVKNLTRDAPPSAANLSDALILPFPLLHFPAQRYTTIS
jgi:hypothetical protein